MLRPKRMSRISVTGSKRVMDDAIEAVHDLNLLHVTDYDDTWEGFDPGDPVEGAEEAAEKLVTVRALQSTLDVTEEDAGRTRIIDDDELEAELEETRQRVNELDDRRQNLRDELREIDDNVETARPFAELGIDLDLLSGYDSLTAAVGEGNADELRLALADAEAVDDYELFEESGYVAIFAYPEVDLQDALVGTAFTRYEVPDLGDSDEATSPEAYIEDLEHRRGQVESKLETVEKELAETKHEVAGFLLAAEEKLAIEVQKLEAPLTFATTENAFVAEGWIPTEQYPDLERTLQSAVGDHVELEELERAEYDEHGHPHETEGVDDAGSTDKGAAVTDGGHRMSGGEPPVVQDNPKPAKPFEALVGVINRPKYSEFDPTIVLLLTFPAFFGFMISDVGYGLLYVLLGYGLIRGFEGDMMKSLGGVAIWAGAFTIFFGILLGEFFGFHFLGDILYGGDPPMGSKGLSPYYGEYALGWLLVSVLVGMVHLTIGWGIDFVENLSHGLKDAVLESGSWILMLFGLWGWIFSHHVASVKPAFMIGEDAVFNGSPFALGFGGFSETVGIALLGVFVVGLVMIAMADIVEFIEAVFLQVLVNGLSYTRMTAVLLAKAGMAFVVNLLVFGVYVTERGGDDYWHFGLGGMPGEAGATFQGEEVTAIMFEGVVHGGVGGILAGIVILIVGHLIVLALGITSAGLQGIRLEYVEFFGKFYEGGGKKYSPFGYERSYTTED